MAAYTHRKRTRVPRWFTFMAVVSIAAGGWWIFFSGDKNAEQNARLASNQPSLTSDRPEDELTSNLPDDFIERGDDPIAEEGSQPYQPEPQYAMQQAAAGRRALAEQDWVTAREQLNEALRLGLDAREAIQVRADLARIADETIFSPRILEDDPLVERYIIQAGDTLGKIAKRYTLSPNFLAEANRIPDVNRIRIGQTLKVVKGPFHARIDKSSYSLDVYLGEGDQATFLRRYKVGLGADNSTPTGMWKVKNKLKNPTYYPPRGGQIIDAGNPENPLGERWVGLVGVSGEAVGQMRYGIHGTIDPDSIGRDASMGCVRMYNEDVASLFNYLVVEQSTIEIQ